MKNRNLQSGDHWRTPKYFYDPLDREFKFTFDPCPYKHDVSVWDGLVIPWGLKNFINPPYSQKLKEAFIRKAVQESKLGKLCIMLLPVATETAIFHDVILPNQDEIRFVRRRIKFEGYNTKGVYVTNKVGQSGSMVVVFNGLTI